MKRILPYLMIMVLLGANGAWGQEAVPGEAADTNDVQLAEAGDAGSSDASGEWGAADGSWEESAELPPMHYELEPEIRTWLGFRFVDVDGSNRALEYGWPHSSPMGGIVLHYTPLPHRLDFEIDMLNHNDYDSQVSYAYKDVFRLDYRGWALFHNLDHWAPQQPPRTQSDIDSNTGADYDVTARDNRIFLRLKWPDRAYHVFGEFREFDKDGTVQQRVYNFDAGEKTSQSRDIEWTTRKYTAGINGHFGPVEVEYSHRTKTFDSDKSTRLVLFDGANYWPNHATPELETNSDNVKIHTDLQGRIVGSATLIKGEKDNKQSGSGVDFWRAYTDLVFIPVEHVTIAVKYRYDLLEVDNPDFVSEYDAVTGALIRPATATTQSMSRRTNKAEVMARYSPLNNLSFKAGYTFTNTKRYNNSGWIDPDVIPFQGIPSDQNEHRAVLGFYSRPWRELTCKGSVTYAYTHDPAYPLKPMNSFKGRFDAAWTPTYNLTTDAYYRFTRDSNNTANMDFERDNLGILGTWAPTQHLTLYANYDYNRLRNKRDLNFFAGPFGSTVPFPTDAVAYHDMSHMYALGGTYSFGFPLTLDAGFHQSWSKGAFRSNLSVAQGGIGEVETTSGVGELTDLRIRETGGNVRAAYDFPRGWGVSAEYEVNDYQDLEDKPQNGVQDGLAHTVTLLVKKEW